MYDTHLLFRIYKFRVKDERQGSMARLAEEFGEGGDAAQVVAGRGAGYDASARQESAERLELERKMGGVNHCQTATPNIIWRNPVFDCTR
jgi:transposase InsO family protein